MSKVKETEGKTEITTEETGEVMEEAVQPSKSSDEHEEVLVEEGPDSEQFGLELVSVEKTSDFVEKAHQSLYKLLTPSPSIVIGFFGTCAVMVLAYLLLIVPISKVDFTIARMNKVRKPTATSNILEKAYPHVENLHGHIQRLYVSLKAKKIHASRVQAIKVEASRSLALLQSLPTRSKQRWTAEIARLNALYRQLKPFKVEQLSARSAKRFYRLPFQVVEPLYKRLKNRPLHYSGYLKYFGANLFSLSARNLDLILVLVRALLLGFLAAFFIRLFFEDPTIVEA